MAANYTAAAFYIPAIDNAANPSAFGYHHGPIPNHNAGWVPPSRITKARSQITTAENGAAPSAAVALSTVNIGVCDIDCGGVMCGVTFGDQPSLRRHIRNSHPGALTNPARTNVSINETIAGQNAIKLWVRSGGWRSAQYAREPGRGPAGGLIDQYATVMEAIAATDATFAKRFGTRFHRANVPRVFS